MVCLALSHVEHPNGRYQRESVQRAIDWVLSMQCRDGGWASFDKDNDRMVFQYVPFADHNAMLDPATVDITGRILEMLAPRYDKNHPAVRKAMKFIRDEQEPDGSWFGRWGVNYLYGTCKFCAAWKRWRSIITSPMCSKRRSGCAWCRIPTADGERLAWFRKGSSHPSARTMIRPAPAGHG